MASTDAKNVVALQDTKARRTYDISVVIRETKALPAVSENQASSRIYLLDPTKSCHFVWTPLVYILTVGSRPAP